MKLFGIDISRWQGDYNLAQAQAEGAQFVIMKAGGGDDGLYQDRQFENNYAKAEKLGMPKGAYFYGNAFSISEAEKEADKFLSILKGKRFDYPVYYDVEGKMLNQGKAALTEIVLTFLKKVEDAGYFVGVYTSESHYRDHLDDSKLTAYAHWVAKYSKTEPKLSSGAEIGIWQFGGGKNYLRDTNVAGQTTDQDYCYVDYPTKIKAAGLNGYVATQTEPVKPQPDPEPDKSIDELAQEVLSGKWGNGEDRKNRLTEAGYDYSAVQAKVNELVGATPQPAKKTVAELAQEVLAGKWGNGTERKEKLTAAGYDYSAVQAKVNELVNGKTDITPKKSVSEIAKEVIKGDWGNGADRKNRLTAAGYNYAVIQAEVNKQLNK